MGWIFGAVMAGVLARMLVNRFSGGEEQDEGGRFGGDSSAAAGSAADDESSSSSLFDDDSSGSSSITDCTPSINPANGLPMMGCVDIEGNAYGTDSTHWDDHSISGSSLFDDSFSTSSSFDSGSAFD